MASVLLIVLPAVSFRSRLPALIGARGWIVASALGGGMLLFLWLFTAHEAAWRNENLLLLNPMALLLWRFRGTAVERAAALVVAAGLVAAFVLKLFPGAQWNYDMMIWLVPAQVALLWVWYRESRQGTKQGKAVLTQSRRERQVKKQNQRSKIKKALAKTPRREDNRQSNSWIFEKFPTP